MGIIATSISSNESKNKNGWDKYLKFLGILISTVLALIQIFSTENLTEPQNILL